MPTIKSPAKFTGRSYVGPYILDFTDGVAELDGELNDGARAYMEQMGYGIDSEPTALADPEPPADSRDYSEPVVLNQLRDAAVDPQPEDFLPPVNAGQGDPHGLRVVAPGIHAANMPKPIHPGPVGSTETNDNGNTVVVKDTATQEANETNLAEAVLVDQVPVPDATAAAAKVDPVNADQAAPSGEYDPAVHTVAEVNEYLATADETERARVLAAEQSGKNRATVSAPAAAAD